MTSSASSAAAWASCFAMPPCATAPPRARSSAGTARFACSSSRRFPSTPKEGIGELNAELAKWVASYNQRAHSSTKQAPAEAFAAEADKLRFVQGGDQALHDAFMNRMTRKVANDATIRIDGKPFDVPMGLIGEKAEVRFMPGDEGDVWLVGADGSLSRIAPTDKHANASAARVKPAYSIDFGQGA